MVIVALVGTDLHIRIFDASGKKVVDKAENELVSGERLTALKKQLTPIPDESGLSKEHKQKIIGDATSIARHTQSAPRHFSHPPEDISLAQVVSPTIPYLLVFGLLFAAVFALYKPVVTELEVEPRAFDVLRDVGGLAVLLFGMTSAVRVPMLTKDRKWLVWSRLIFWAAIGAYPFVIREVTQQGLGAFFVKYFHTIFGQYSDTLGLLWGLGVAVAMIAEICGWFARNHPKWGVRVLPLAGLVFAAVLVWWLFRSVPVRDDPELWPVLLGGVFAFISGGWRRSRPSPGPNAKGRKGRRPHRARERLVAWAASTALRSRLVREVRAEPPTSLRSPRFFHKLRVVSYPGNARTACRPDGSLAVPARGLPTDRYDGVEAPAWRAQWGGW